MKVIIPAGIGMICTAVTFLYNSRSGKVKRWMQARRIDTPKVQKQGEFCGVCGAPMKTRRREGPKPGVFLVCTNWPECRKVEKISP